jgi:hypothetical protein
MSWGRSSETPTRERESVSAIGRALVRSSQAQAKNAGWPEVRQPGRCGLGQARKEARRQRIPSVRRNRTPQRHPSSAGIGTMVARVAPAVLALLGDGAPRGQRAIVAVLADRHPKGEVVRKLLRLAVTGRLVGAAPRGVRLRPPRQAPPRAPGRRRRQYPLQAPRKPYGADRPSPPQTKNRSRPARPSWRPAGGLTGIPRRRPADGTPPPRHHGRTSRTGRCGKYHTPEVRS